MELKVYKIKRKESAFLYQLMGYILYCATWRHKQVVDVKVQSEMEQSCIKIHLQFHMDEV